MKEKHVDKHFVLRLFTSCCKLQFDCFKTLLKLVIISDNSTYRNTLESLGEMKDKILPVLELFL